MLQHGWDLLMILSILIIHELELIRALELNIRKKEDRPAKKHGNIPL